MKFLAVKNLLQQYHGGKEQQNRMFLIIYHKIMSGYCATLMKVLQQEFKKKLENILKLLISQIDLGEFMTCLRSVLHWKDRIVILQL